MLQDINSDTLEMILFLVAAVFSVPLAKRLGLGSVLGYLIAGAIIGPVLTHYIHPVGESIFNVAEFGIIMMLFLVGLELEPKHLWAMRNKLIGMGGLQIGLTALALAVAMLPFGLNFPTALAAGLILSLSSMAIVIPSLNERKLEKSEGGRSSLAIMLAHDVASVPILAALPALALLAGVHEAPASGGSDGVPAVWRPAWLHGLMVIGAVGALVFGGRYVVRPFLHYVSSSKLHEIFTAAALLIVIGIIALMDYVGLDPAIGAFIGGVVLADSEYKHQITADIEPFKGLLLGIFFVAVGASIDYDTLLAMPWVALAAWIGLVVIKFAVLMIVGLVFRLHMAATLLMALALAQGDEFAFVLLPFATQIGLFSEVQSSILNIAVVLSMASTPLLFMVYERLVHPRFRDAMAPKRKEKADQIESDDHSESLLIGIGDFGGVVGRILEATHHKFTMLDIDSDHVDATRKMGLEAYFGDGREREVLEAAGIAKAKRIVVGIDDEEGTNHIVMTVKKYFPEAKLFVRAMTRPHAYKLVQMGVDHVYVEAAGSALHLSMDILRELGVPQNEVHAIALAYYQTEKKSIRIMSKEPLYQQSYFLRARDTLEMLRQQIAEIRSDPPEPPAAR